MVDAQGSTEEPPAVPEVRELYRPGPHNGTGRAGGTPGPKGYGGQNWLLWLCLTFRVVVACLGRRWGKTQACMRLILEKAARKKGRFLAGYGTPTARLARRRYEEFLGMFRAAGYVVRPNRQDLVLEIDSPINGCTGITIFFWGLKEYDNIRGEALDLLILDECKDILSRAYFSALRPMLMDSGGSVLLMGTPSRLGKGAVWYRKQFLIAKSGKDPDYAWLTGPTHDNPLLTEANIVAAMRDVESEGGSYEEEILARWLEDEGAVFQNLPNVFTVPAERHENEKNNLWTGEEPDRGVRATDHLHPGREPDDYVIGFDIAIKKDSSVAAVFNRRTRDMAALLRMTRQPDDYQFMQLLALHEKYNHAPILFDGNGLGLGFTGEMGRKFGKYAVPIVWNTQSKLQDIRRAQILCQRGGKPGGEGWALIKAPWLYAEFEAYQVETEDTQGRTKVVPKYGAPPGLHDDGVSACMLATSYLMSTRMPEETTVAPAMFSGQWAIDRIEQRVGGGLSRR